MNHALSLEEVLNKYFTHTCGEKVAKVFDTPGILVFRIAVQNHQIVLRLINQTQWSERMSMSAQLDLNN